MQIEQPKIVQELTFQHCFEHSSDDETGMVLHNSVLYGIKILRANFSSPKYWQLNQDGCQNKIIKN